MTQRTQLGVDESGYVRRNQLWLKPSDGSNARLFVEPLFVDRSERTRDMLRITCRASKARRGEMYYSICLPPRKEFEPLTQHITEAAAKQRGLITVNGVLIMGKLPGQKPFATPVFFYFYTSK